MLSLQTEIERILEQTGDFHNFKNQEHFSGDYQIRKNVLTITRTMDDISIAFKDDCFEFQRQKYNPAWYPIKVQSGSETISIIIRFENGPAHSAKNWFRFIDLADKAAIEIAAIKIAGIDLEVMTSINKPRKKDGVFEQMSLW
jgi:hypothetical protein